MRIKKYDFNYGRRMLMEKVLRGASAAGVLAPLWPLIGDSADITKAYPDELLSIEAQTRGKIKVGDVVTAENADVVKDLLDPIVYQQVKTMGRRINIVESTRDATRLFPYEYLMATLKNKGRARMDADGNTWTDDGSPWAGGLPYPEPKNGLEAEMNLTMSWGRHDFAMYAIPDVVSLGPEGNIDYNYDLVWAELQVTGRPDGTIFQNKKDLCRYQSVWFTAPNDTAGSSFLNVWYYDQRKFPDLYGYLPAFKRVRQFPTNQRFEPLVPGMTLFLSDAWAAGDPLLTWGNYKIVERKPFLGCIGPANFMGGQSPNWDRPVHGGPKGKTFYDTWFELIPECIVVEAQPTGFPRAPVSKKRVYIDARNSMFPTYVTFDRRGDIWKSFEPGFSQFSNDKLTVKDERGHPEWSWLYVHSHDFQANRMTRWRHALTCKGGFVTTLSDQGKDVYNKYLTVQAIARLGSS